MNTSSAHVLWRLARNRTQARLGSGAWAAVNRATWWVLADRFSFYWRVLRGAAK